MKKIFSLLVALSLFGAVTFAQKPSDAKAKPTTQVVKPDVKKSEKKEVKKAPLVKKDGTPDKRFKENKEAKPAPAAGPLKKDGTPDKRYKANKKAK